MIIGADLAEADGVSVKTLNQALRRNADRFPSDVMFRLTKEEKLEGDPLNTMKILTIISIAAIVLIGRADSVTPSPRGRPARWAKPIELEGVPNLHKVSDTLYRSAQPTAEGMQALKTFGIETIVNLRSFHSDRNKISNTGLVYEHIYMKAWHPEEKEAVRFLQIATNPKRTPVLVHCQHGADRTGTMCALYRVAVQGWRKEDAIDEMIQGDFGFHGIWDNLIRWINALDIEKIKAEAGMR